jgi:hypothetical protein
MSAVGILTLNNLYTRSGRDICSPVPFAECPERTLNIPLIYFFFRRRGEPQFIYHIGTLLMWVSIGVFFPEFPGDTGTWVS